MPLPIEDYALIADGHTAALVGKDGSIDWLCLPRFDSAACFAALLGSPENGRWHIAPEGEVLAVRRRYRPGTLVLETEFETAEGTVAIIDCMPLRNDAADLVRLVEGRSGRVRMAMELVLRFDYGSLIPWVHRAPDGALLAVCGPDQVALRTPATLHGEGYKTCAEFTVAAGEAVPFHLVWTESHKAPGPPVDALCAIATTEHHWSDWLAGCRIAEESPHPEMLRRSLLTLKALTYAPTGGIVAAPTTSLPETLGGDRNWDYRLCWLRDAALTLHALVRAGHLGEAEAWRSWLLRAVAGSASQVRPLYGLAGQRRTPEMILPWLPGYEGAAPVRIGNEASAQLQLDVYGEVVDAFYTARHVGLRRDGQAWAMTREMLNHLMQIWREPDSGLWEVRGPRRHFVQSKVMVWVAFDRAIRAAEEYGLDGPLETWRAVRAEVHAQVCAQGFDAGRGSFTQSYGSPALDASLLRMPLVGFLPADDPRIGGTVRAIEEELLEDGLVLRYRPDPTVEGLKHQREGTFLACTAWLGEVYALQGRWAEANAVLDRLIGLANDVGLLAEEYDTHAGRQVGNFPQAFSHLGLVGLAFALANHPARERAKGETTQPAART
ncbi:glycoside hydrolase family 15 protein [Siccirubricoccus sp. KC 17139]|uniref:Glycoside hydrolase family 15 protein n=1 Tax=Siccirubricoccus soli TaxID=2899147 RepID=A0ABT1CYX2_9PROT|nr:glycoside hydrolase family 15 protein [Siccirubricoccus soli]MCO6414868.1 glycoside hydrolase family 15 protein [Siccirubricoccus soli]MCP2680998.1 glycoside hydrolase family 15 protein [Siccirubricoccus soli]